MRSMREIMLLVEGKDASFPTVNGDAMVGEIMSLMGILEGMDFEFSADWVKDALAEVKQRKLECEHDVAAQRLKDETEGTGEDEQPESDPEPSEEDEGDSEDETEKKVEESAEETEESFDVPAAYREAADAVQSKNSHAQGILADVVTAERVWKDNQKVDPDNLANDVDESGYLTCMQAQRDLLSAIEGVTPSKPSSYNAVIQGVHGVLELMSKDDSEVKPEFVGAVKKELENLLPLLRFTLTVV